MCSAYQILFILGEWSNGIWEEAASIKDPELIRRAEHLPTVIMSAWADSTNDKYSRGWKEWVEWCNRYPEAAIRPASPFYVALFLNDLVLDEAKKGHIETVFLGIRWGHRTAGFESPTDHPFVKTALEGAKRITARKTTKNRKEPLDSDILKQLYKKFGMSDDAIHLRFLVTCFLGFAGFLRISELKQVQIKHISFKSDHMTVLLEESKTDKLREGEVVYISKLERGCCPVSLTKQYITTTKLDKDEDNFNGWSRPNRVSVHFDHY